MILCPASVRKVFEDKGLSQLVTYSDPSPLHQNTPEERFMDVSSKLSLVVQAWNPRRLRTEMQVQALPEPQKGFRLP